jgi:hypothetical protein
MKVTPTAPEVVQDCADQASAGLMTRITWAWRTCVAGLAFACAGRREWRLRTAARLRLHQRAQTLKDARSVAGSRVQSPPRDVRSRGMDDDALLVCDMNE